MNKRVIVCLLCVLMLTTLAGCKSAGEMISDGAEYIQEAASGVDPVSDVKRISFPEQLGNDATIGEMVDLVLYDTEWISDKTGEDTYYVQVQGTIEEDIPDYRKAGNEICILAFNVKYIGNAVSIEEDPSGSYWPTTSTSYSPIYHLNAAYKIAAGITPNNLIWDDNKNSTNPKLPIYNRNSEETYSYTQHTDDTFETNDNSDLSYDEELLDEESIDYIFDWTDLLTASQFAQLDQLASVTSLKYSSGVYIVIVQDYRDFNNASPYEAAKTIYNNYGLGLGNDQSGTLLMLSMEDRDYAYIAHGEFGNYAFTDYGKEQLTHEFLDNFLNDDWYGGFHDYIVESDYYMQRASEGNPVDQF